MSTQKRSGEQKLQSWPRAFELEIGVEKLHSVLRGTGAVPGCHLGVGSERQEEQLNTPAFLLEQHSGWCSEDKMRQETQWDCSLGSPW